VKKSDANRSESKKRAAAILTVFLLLSLCSCGGKTATLSVDGLAVYRAASSLNAGDRYLLKPESVSPADGQDELSALLAAIEAAPGEGFLPALPDGITITDCERRGGEIAVTLSGGFAALGEYEKTIIKSCLTLSFLSVSDITTVSVYCGGEVYALGLTADDIMLADIESNPFERPLRLYFMSEDRRYLTAETRTLSVGRDGFSESYALSELLRGPYSPSLLTAVPEGTTVNSVSVDDGVCAVDLSAEFLSGCPDTFIEQRLAVLSVVNTLTSITGVREVVILTDGVILERYGEYTPVFPMSRNDAATGPVNTVRGETDINIAVYGADGSVFLLPRISQPELYSSPAEAVLSYMLSGEREPGYQPIFAYGGEYISVAEYGAECSINLPGSFFVTYGGDSFDDQIAALKKALAATNGAAAEAERNYRLRLYKDGVLFGTY